MTNRLTIQLPLDKPLDIEEVRNFARTASGADCIAKQIACQLLAAMQENERLRVELKAASNQLELLAYSSAGHDHGLSKFCAGLAGHLQMVLNQNEVSDVG